jgi:hypothetical protein
MFDVRRRQFITLFGGAPVGANTRDEVDRGNASVEGPTLPR